MRKLPTFMIVFLFLFEKIGNVLTEVKNPLNEVQIDKLKQYRDKKAQKQGYYDQEYLDMIIQDENPSWLCDQVSTIKNNKNFAFEHYFNIQMNHQFEIYYSRISEYNKTQKKMLCFSKFLKIENFETNKTTKVLRELNYSFQMSDNPYFNKLDKCYYEQRKATIEHVRKYPNLKIGDDIGERIYMVFNKYTMNAYEYLTTERINHKTSNIKDLEIIELIKNIAIGVRELHKFDLVHTNLSLSNIGLQKRQRLSGYVPKIQNLDWTTKEEEQEYNSEMGQNLYKAPEFIKGEQKNIKQIDIYALGIIFYALMAKKQARQFVQTNNNYSDKQIYMQKGTLSSHKELLAIFRWMTDEDFRKRPTIVKVKLELINYRNCFQKYVKDLKKSKAAKKKCAFKYQDNWKPYFDIQTQNVNQDEKILMNLADMIHLKQYLLESDMNTNREIPDKNASQKFEHKSIDRLMKEKILQNFIKKGEDQYKKKWPKFAESEKQNRIKLLQNMEKQLDKKREDDKIVDYIKELFPDKIEQKNKKLLMIQINLIFNLFIKQYIDVFLTLTYNLIFLKQLYFFIIKQKPAISSFIFFKL